MMIWLAAICAGVCLYQVSQLLLADDDNPSVQKRLKAIEILGADRMEKPKRWEGSFLTRSCRLIFGRLVGILGRVIPVNEKEKARIRNLMARCGLKFSPEEYVVLQLLTAAGGGLAGMYYATMFEKPVALGAVAGLYGGYALFRFFIGKKASRRQAAILEQFPEFMDLLCISVEAGLGFNQAFQYIADQCEGPLADEFLFAGRAMLLGQSRRSALEDMAARCDLDEIRTFVSAVIQADEMGISMKGMLAAQSKEARQAKRMRTEEQAQKVPIKMLLPIGIFIFPVLMIIILGPAVPQIMEAL